MSVHRYVVTWTIDVWATNPRDAARQARKAQQPRDTIATVLKVADMESGETVTVDLWQDQFRNGPT